MGVYELNVMVFVMVGGDGLLSSCIVLLCDFDLSGFEFFMSYSFDKGLVLWVYFEVVIVFLWYLIYC